MNHKQIQSMGEMTMTFLNDVKINLCAMAECAGDKAGKLAELARLKVCIAGIGRTLNDKYCFLGRLAYRASREEAVSEAGMTQLTEEITALLQERAALDEQVRRLKRDLYDCGCACEAVSEIACDRAPEEENA